jgi:hypothetical protein
LPPSRRLSSRLISTLPLLLDHLSSSFRHSFDVVDDSNAPYTVNDEKSGCVEEVACKDYVLEEDECVAECPDFYGTDETKKECYPCPEDALSCDGTKALSCGNNAALYEGTCLSNCPDEFVARSAYHLVSHLLSPPANLADCPIFLSSSFLVPAPFDPSPLSSPLRPVR